MFSVISAEQQLKWKENKQTTIRIVRENSRKFLKKINKFSDSA